MYPDTVWSVYFSATGSTKKAVTQIASKLSQLLGSAHQSFDFTLPQAREQKLQFGPGDLVVFGTPVIAGRVPNVLLPYLKTVEGGGALAVPVVLYGNRNYDDALIELRDLLEADGFHTIAAAAMIGEHSFSYRLAQGRPDAQDLAFADRFGEKVAQAVQAGQTPSPIAVNGTPYPYRGYYIPRDRKGQTVDIRKVKPQVRDTCTRCMICVDRCPMGSISREDVTQYQGICIKCGACIKSCPEHARYYTDEGYLYHKNELEEEFTRRAEPEWFLPF